MAEPVLTTGALLVGSTKAAVAMVPAIAIICTATYLSFKLIDFVDDKLEERKAAKTEKKGMPVPGKGSRYRQYLREKHGSNWSQYVKGQVNVPVPQVAAG